MKQHSLTKKWGIVISFWLMLGFSVQPLFALSDTSSDEAIDESSTCSFLKQDEIGRSRPFQAQLLLSGGGTFRNRSYNPGAGIHLGYRISDLMYLGLTSQAFVNSDSSLDKDEDKRYDDETVYGQEGARKTTVDTDPRHLIEMRFFPWRFGLYFSAGIMHFGKEKTVTEFKSRPRVINENEYITGMTTTLEYEAWTGAAAGMGLQHVFNNGFTLNGGVNVGLAVQSPDVTIETDVAVAATDLQDWKDQIETNEKRIPIMFNIGVGYAF